MRLLQLDEVRIMCVVGLILEDINGFVNTSIMTENKLNEPRCR